MKRTTPLWICAGLAAGLSVVAFGGGDRDQKGPSPEQRKEFQQKRAEFLEKRLAKLPVEEQKLARALEPLRDSLMGTIGEYHRKVKDGAAPRSLTTDRATIASLQSQIQKLQADNQEVWLDLLADLPGPGGPGGKGGPPHGWMGGKDGRAGGPECPKHEEDHLPPPPPPLQ